MYYRGHQIQLEVGLEVRLGVGLWVGLGERFEVGLQLETPAGGLVSIFETFFLAWVD